MRAAFFHDHKFRRADSGKLFSTGGLSYHVLSRYLEHFEALTVVARESALGMNETIDALTVATGEGLEFRCVATRNKLDALYHTNVRRVVRQAILSADCVIARLPSTLGYIACHEAVRRGKPWAVEVVGCSRDALWNYGNILGKLVALPYSWLQKHYVRKAPYAIYVSRHFLQARYECRGFSANCPDAAIPESGQEVLERRLARIDNGLRDRRVYFGLIGSLDVCFKGHETAIRGLASIRGKIPDFRLRFLGGGSPERWRRLAMECGIVDKVIFDGTLPGGEAVFAWMDNLDVFLMPSLQETLGRSLLEAMSRGCPAFGSRETAVPEQLGDDCVHHAKAFEELGGLIVHMLDNPEYMRLCAIENFYRARKYSDRLVDGKRQEFWGSFVAHVRERMS